MFIPGKEIIDKIDAVYPLNSVSMNGDAKHDPAKLYQFDDGKGDVGFISSVTEPFCEQCNRIRLTADGQLRTCLFSITETDLLTPLRAGSSDETIEDLIIEAVKQKEAGHQINAVNFVKPKRNMSMIGG